VLNAIYCILGAQRPGSGGGQLPSAGPVYKDPYSTHNINYKNTKDVLYMRKVYYMNTVPYQPNSGLPQDGSSYSTGVFRHKQL